MKKGSTMFKSIIIVFILLSFSVYADTVWNFETGTQGWQIADLNTGGPYETPVGFYPVNHYATGGNPGGYMGGIDPTANTFSFCMPQSVFSCIQTFNGGNLSFSMKCNYNNWTSEPYLIVVCGSQVLLSYIPVPTDYWQDYSIDFHYEDFFRYSGPGVTDEQFMMLMTEVTAIYIVAEYGAGVYEHTDLDSVVLSGVIENTPETPIADINVVSVSDEVTVSWNVIPGVAGYNVFVLPAPDAVPVATYFTTDNFITLSATENKRFYKVTAVCGQ